MENVKQACKDSLWMMVGVRVNPNDFLIAKQNTHTEIKKRLLDTSNMLTSSFAQMKTSIRQHDKQNYFSKDNYRYNIEKSKRAIKRMAKLNHSLSSATAQTKKSTLIEHSLDNYPICRYEINDTEFDKCLRDIPSLADEAKDLTGQQRQDGKFDAVSYFSELCIKFVKRSPEYKTEQCDGELKDIQRVKPKGYVGTGHSLKDLRLESSAKDVLDQAIERGSVSKEIVHTLDALAEEDTKDLAKELCLNIDKYIDNKNTCFIVKTICRNDDRLAKACGMYILPRLSECLKNASICKLTYTLCIHSKVFRENLLVMFRNDLVELLSTLEGAVLVSLLIDNTKIIEFCSLIYSKLKADPGILKKGFFCRAFASYMKRCQEEKLVDIAKILEQHINFLLRDKFGNYLLQIFFIRQCKFGMEMCKRAMIKYCQKTLNRKHSRYVLYIALLRKEIDEFPENLIEAVISNQELLEKAVCNRFSSCLILFALAKAYQYRMNDFSHRIRELCKKYLKNKRKDKMCVIKDFLVNLDMLC